MSSNSAHAKATAEENEADEEGEEAEENEAAEHGQAAAEKEITREHAPAAVGAAIDRVSKGGKVDRITQETDAGASVYEVEFTRDGGKCSADISAAGDVLTIERELAKTALPAAASKAVMALAAGATVQRVESVELHLYEVGIAQDGKHGEVRAYHDGRILDATGFGGGEEDEAGEEDEEDEAKEAAEHAPASGEQSIDLAKAPEAVRKAVEHIVADGRVGRVTHESDEGASIYEVEFTRGGAECTASLTDDGEAMEVERKIEKSELPHAVVEKIGAKYHGAAIERAETLQLHFFEVKLVSGSKAREIKVFANGEVWTKGKD
jgi:uncharacterized membrane protein YkoI